MQASVELSSPHAHLNWPMTVKYASARLKNRKMSAYDLQTCFFMMQMQHPQGDNFDRCILQCLNARKTGAYVAVQSRDLIDCDKADSGQRSAPGRSAPAAPAECARASAASARRWPTQPGLRRPSVHGSSSASVTRCRAPLVPATTFYRAQTQKQGTGWAGGPKVKEQACATVCTKKARAYALMVLLPASGITGVPERRL